MAEHVGLASPARGNTGLTMAILNIRVDETLRRKIANLAKALGTTQTDLVKNAITGRITAHETAKAEAETAIPEWVPDGKCVALVRGAVAAVGDSVAEVVADAIAKFGDEPIHVALKRKPIRPIHYAFAAHATVKCWKYLTADGESFPIIPAKIIGKKELTTASSPDRASTLALVSREIIDQAGLQPEAQETIYTAAGQSR